MTTTSTSKNRYTIETLTVEAREFGVQIADVYVEGAHLVFRIQNDRSDIYLPATIIRDAAEQALSEAYGFVGVATMFCDLVEKNGYPRPMAWLKRTEGTKQ